MDCENSYLTKLERGNLLTKDEFEGLVKRVTSVLDAEPNLLHLDCPITVVPYLRGNFKALLQYITVSGSPPESKFLFLGHYGNSDDQGLHALSYVLALKDLYPHRIILLRNAIDSTESRIYGLYEKMRQAYASKPLYEAVIKLFSCLPIAAVISNKVYCGGLAQAISTFDDFSQLQRREPNVYDYGVLEELMTSYPTNDYDGWYLGNVRVNSYGREIVEKFCEANGIEFIIRGSSYKPAETCRFDNKLVTLFPGMIMKIRMGDNDKIETQLIEAINLQ